MFFNAKADQLDVLISPLYIKVNCPPHFFDCDLLHAIDDAHPRNKTRISRDEARGAVSMVPSVLYGLFGSW